MSRRLLSFVTVLHTSRPCVGVHSRNLIFPETLVIYQTVCRSVISGLSLSNVLLWFVLCNSGTLSSAKTLCPRIFFQNINEVNMPYKIIEGVYVKENFDNLNFPVYKRENNNLMFYHFISEKGNSFLVFGHHLKDYFGVAATIYRSVKPSVWLRSGVLDRSDVFNGLLHQWQYHNLRDQTNYAVTSSPMIKAVCVDDDFRECNSDRVYLNDNFTDRSGNVVNDVGRDYFSRREGSFRNLRPVYQHITQPWYLQYVDGYWLVSGSFRASGPNDNAFMRVKDLALRPEYITNTWSVYFNGWRDMPSLRLLCRGVTSMSNTCPSKPCYGNANCVYTSGNETLCVCPPGYSGLRCSVNKQCPIPSPILLTELNFAYPGRRPGDLGMSFCSGPYPSFRFSLCIKGSRSPFWSRQGSACRQRVVTRSPTPTRTPVPATTTPWWYHRRTFETPTAKPINFDDNSTILITVIPAAIFLQILLPFVVFCGAFCYRKCKKDQEEQDDQRRLQEFGGELERRLEMVARAQSQEERDQGVQEYRHTAEEYRKETEEKELSRKRGFYRNVSLLRLYSIDMYFSFFLWLIYLVGCDVTECTRHGTVLQVLRIFAIVMLVVSPLVVLCESFFSHELVYLKNIMHNETAWQYIQRMHGVPPTVNMFVECYHFETRTRVVYYTDANGNHLSRTETYQEKVVTFVGHEQFSFGSWLDVSKREMPEISDVVMTRLKIDPSIVFGDQETADDYERQAADMIERNRYRDAFIDYSSSRDVPGLKTRIFAYVDLKVRPFWMRPLYFWIATILLMTWPFRWLFRAKTAKKHYILKKRIYKSTTPPREADLMDPIANLVGNASFAPPSTGPDSGRGNPAFQRDCAPYPPLDSEAAAAFPLHPVTTQPTALPPPDG